MKGLAVNQLFILVGLTPTPILSPNTRRYGFVIGCPVANRVTLAFGDAVVLDAGINIFAGQAPLSLLAPYVGQAWQGGLFGIAAVAPQAIGVWEYYWV